MLLGSECFFALRSLGVGGVLRFVLREDLFDARVIQRQWLALVGLLESVEQGLYLQVGDFLAQPFAKACAQAIGKVVRGYGGGV